MAKVDDREAFEHELGRPPHQARMMEHAARYVGMLDKDDKNALLEYAVDRLFETRAQIKETKDVLKVWIEALEYAALRRPYWLVCFNGYEWRRVKGARLGRG